MPSAGIMASAVTTAVPVCNDVLEEPFDNLFAWDNQGGIIVEGRTGAYALGLSGSTFQTDYVIAAPVRSDVLTVGFAWQYTDAIASNRRVLGLWSGSPVGPFTEHTRLNYNPATSTISVARPGGGGSDVVLASATIALAVNTWYYIELRATLGDAPTGAARVRVNGTDVINATAIDTYEGGAQTAYDRVKLECDVTGCIGLYDDLYISTGGACTFKGDHPVYAPCNNVMEEPFDTAARWVGSGSSIVAGRTGTAMQTINITHPKFTIPLAQESDLITLGFAYRWTDAFAARFICILQSGTTTPDQIRISVTPASGVITVQRFTTTIASSASGVLTANTWAYIEIQTRLRNDATGFVIVRVNGTEVINFTGDTQNAVEKTTYDAIDLGPGLSGAVNQYDDLYLSTGPACTFRGNQAFATPLPLTLSGLLLWLDADDLTMFSFSSRDIVSQWRDKSGGARHFAQATTANQPKRLGPQNGRGAVTFVDTSDRLASTGVVNAATSAFTWFVACNRTGGASTESTVLHNGSSATNGYALSLRANSANIGLLRANILHESTATPDPAAPGVLTLQRQTGASGLWSLWLDGVQTNLASTGTISTPATATTIPAYSTFAYVGDIYEVLGYNRVLTTTERQAVEAYLKTKWGTP